MPQFVPGQHVHIVGVGGFGMSAIARILLEQGYYVSGSDRRPNVLTQALATDGADIHIGEAAENVMGAEMVLASAAIATDHVELALARALNIPVYKRADVIADLMDGQACIAVAGTHGKTTTTSMITHILLDTMQQPSYIIGGILRNTGQNAGVGAGKAFVIEADEYDNMFHGLLPQVTVLTTVEYDHPDFFKTPAEMVQSFNHFIGLLPDDGLLIAGSDDPTSAIMAQNRFVAGLPVTTYGIQNRQAQWQAQNIHIDDKYQTVFDVMRDGRMQGIVELQLPGEYNVLNALAALIVADQQGVPFEAAARALKTFQGAGRRFHARGEVDGVLIVDDYAHHPTAIKLTLAAARERFPERKLWAVWQPHTYSRTQHLWDAYTGAFDAADEVLVTDIYAAREDPIAGINSAELTRSIRHEHVRHVPSLDAAVADLVRDVEPPALILIMSAGDAPLIGVNYLKLRQQR